ncbi:TonB-dependent receptor [Fibrisoma montanum]|uniref:TonB-dependent receptor n=2 Tax=Fibrisoma montanum TaxID=2305895 RepID=A0A418LVJ2_9BACT|nr:TonB-dependent receptor [Fibrisoma montanum]
MRNAYFLFFLSLITHSVMAQTPGKLTGTLKDEAGAAISFGTVAVVPASTTTIVTGGVSEADGKFAVQTPAVGTYRLRITAVGYKQFETPAFTVTAPDFAKNFGTIGLKSDVKQLKEVNVQALQPTITQEADRMVVSVEGTAMVAGNTVFQMLAKIPGVFIDQEGNIQLNGRNGVTVMLDGKLTYLSARDLRTMFEGMSAENVKNVEIITNPSAKYDAEGSSGILNINLKKNTQRGMNGSLYAGYTYNGKQHGYNSGGTINYKSGSWNSFANLDWARRVGGREATFTRIFYGEQQTTYFDQVATGNFQAQGPPAVRVGTDYSLNDRHTIGAMAYYNTNQAYSNFLTDTYIGSNRNRPSQYINADNYTSSRFTNFTSNLHYAGKLDTSGTTLTADLDYARITNPNRSDFFNYFRDLNSDQPDSTDFLFTDIRSGYTIYAAKMDFTRPFSRGRKLEMGAKASRVISDNDARFYLNNGDVPVLDTRRTNHFYYREFIYAAYLNWNTKLGERYTVQAGLRAEQTVSNGQLLTTGQETNRSYLSLFPSLFIQQKVNADYDINYSYSRRIQRPNYGNLNPFILYRDPYTWWQGNPYLRPQYTHAFSMTHSFRKRYSLIMSYQLVRDVIAELPLLDTERATTVYYIGNVNDGHNVSLTGIVPIKFGKRWESSNTLVMSYNKYNTVVNQTSIANDRLFYMIQSNQTIQLPFDLRAEVNGSYRGPTAYGLYFVDSQWWIHLALKKTFLNKALDLSLNANDIFKGQRIKTATVVDRNVNEFDQYFRARTIGVTLRYKFSRGQKVDESRRSNSLEELNRTGG